MFRCIRAGQDTAGIAHMSRHHPREFRIITRIVGDFGGFRPGNLFVLEHEPNRVWRQVGHQVEEGIYRVDPPCVVYFDLARCVAEVQMVLSVESFGDTIIERVRTRPITW
jgi:hypothetical protein